MFSNRISFAKEYRTLPGLSLFALIVAPFLNSWQNTVSHCSSQSPFGILNCIYCPDLPPVIYLFKVGIFDHWWVCQGGEERADEIAQTIFWSGWWKHLTLWDSEKSFPNTNVIELCVSALQRKGTTLALWSYQREGKEGPHLFQTNFSKHWEWLLYCLWALSHLDDIADKLGICFCHWQEAVLKHYLIYGRCTVSFFFFLNPRQFTVDSSFHSFLNIGTYDCIKLAAGSSADIF